MFFAECYVFFSFCLSCPVNAVDVYVVDVTLCLCSVALIVDNPQLFNRIADMFIAKATMKLVVLLWGEKSELNGEVSDKFPIFNYQEIIEMGRHNRKLLTDSHDASKAGIIQS